MSTQVQPAIFVSKNPQALPLRRYADRVLRWAAGFWFIVVVLGQIIFAVTVASFYGLTAARGHWQQWNKNMTHGYSADHPVGNVVVAIHLISAVVITLSGAIQLVPLVRRKAPLFHRWNGRVYMVTAFSVSLAGLYMLWMRGAVGDLPQHIGQSLDGVLIMVFAVLALRTALARDFAAHRRWALRLFLAVTASLFIRAGVFLTIVLNHGPLGFDGATFTGPFLTFMAFGQYLVPLAVLELYLRTQQRGGAWSRFAMAGGLVALTVLLGMGIASVSMAGFLPLIKRAFDSRISIGETLLATLDAQGIDQAARQYRELRQTSPAAYDFDEDELNGLGYNLIQRHKYSQAVRILQLNADAYPQSANAWDSLGEAFMDYGKKAQAIAAYRKSLQLNPANVNAVQMIRKMAVS
jgi:uncharacterized membrane protein